MDVVEVYVVRRLDGWSREVRGSGDCAESSTLQVLRNTFLPTRRNNLSHCFLPLCGDR